MNRFQYLSLKFQTGIPGPVNNLSGNRRAGIISLSNAWIRIRRTVRPAMICFLFLLLTFVPPSQLRREFNIKAQYLYNFTQFIEWPPEAFPYPGAPFVIGIIGEDPFGTA